MAAAKGDKITVENICGGELKAQLARALEAVAANIDKYGNEADHEIALKVSFGLNPDYKYWETEPQTVVKCTVRDKEIGAKTPIAIHEGSIFDGTTQQKLPLTSD